LVVVRPDYSQLPKDRDVVLLASGGRDSTAMVLEAWNIGIKDAVMGFNDTGLNRGGGKEVLNQLQEYTGYELVTVKYDGSRPVRDILQESFKQIPKVLKKKRATGKFYKNYFYCCHVLKKKPMDNYIGSLNDNVILVLGLKGSDGAKVRRFLMAELRDQDTFIRVHKRNNQMYYYPLRDCSDRDIDMILDEHGFGGIQSTGCNTCPVFCVFPNMRKRDPMTWLRSVALARKLGIEFPLHDQAKLSDFCKG